MRITQIKTVINEKKTIIKLSIKHKIFNGQLIKHIKTLYNRFNFSFIVLVYLKIS